MPKPKGSEESSIALGTYIAINLVLVDLAILEFAVVLAMKKYQCFKPSPKPTSPQALVIESHDYEHFYCQIDISSFVVYIVIYILFNFTFWLIYLI